VQLLELEDIVQRLVKTKRFKRDIFDCFNDFIVSNNYVLSSIVLSPNQKEVLIGTMLGDTYLERQKPTYNARLRFDQTYPSHEGYIDLLYSIFYDLTGPQGSPSIHNRKPDKRTGKIYSTIAFKTRRLPCLTPYHDLFYLNRIKVIPNNIKDLLTPVALAFWIMDDGGLSSSNQTLLHTDSYTLKEVELLQFTLLKKFGLRTRLVEKRRGQWLIAIPIRQEIPLKDIVGAFMLDSMKYKIKGL
jgi:hypothetical protein